LRKVLEGGRRDTPSILVALRSPVLFLGTNVAIIALISITFRLLGIEGLLQANQVDLDLNALLVYSAVIGFSGSLISLFISKWMAKRSMRVQLIEQPRSEMETWLLDTVARQAGRSNIGMPEVGIFQGGPNAFATGWNNR
jgi:heat shock protein HtpX